MQSAPENSTSNAHNPLVFLSEILASDMGQVDALIIKNMQSDVSLIPKLAEYLVSAGGKRIRPLLTLASTALFTNNLEKSYTLAAAVEFIHTATLLHDDVVDESYERRGRKTANLVFGNQASVLVGDFLFSKAFQMMVESGSLDVLRTLSNASAVIAQGEVLQLITTNNIETNLDEYKDVIEAKTAALFAAACEVGPIITEQDQDNINAMRAYGNAVGNAFQVIDDLLDYNADTQTIGKEIGDDFKEGKMTAPVIFALQHADEEETKFWKRTIGHKEQSETDFETAHGYMAKHNAFEKSYDLAKSYAEEAKSALKTLPNSQMKKLLAQIADYTISRHM